MKRSTRIILGIVVGVVAVIGIIGLVGAYMLYRAGQQFWAAAEQFDELQQPWVECPVDLVDLADETERIVFLRRHIHPFLAEYRRKVRIERAGHEDVTCPLPINVGGRTMINVYWIDERGGYGPLMLMREHWGEYLVDLAAAEIHQIVHVGKDRVYAGVLESDERGPGTMTDSTGDITVHVGDHETKEITDYDIFGRMTYIGRIDGRTGSLRFVPASESPEEKIGG